jgi:uncharacterized protein YjbI with pentapeptide repeats
MNEALAELQAEQQTFRGNRSHLQRLLDALRSGAPTAWNEWRRGHPTLRPDLRGANLQGAALSDFNLASARLAGARLTGVRAWQAHLAKADLRQAHLDMAELNYSDVRGANFDLSRLVAANLTLVNAQGASFLAANLSHAVLNGARLQGADLTGARVAGTSAWGIQTDARTRQNNLVVDAWVDPLEDVVDDTDAAIRNIIVHVDHIEAAHLLYLISTRGKFKTVVDALTTRVVLLLGNFASRRKAVLNAVRHKLADLGYAPVVFDFAAPVDRDLIETVALIAGLSRFVIADLTRPRSTPLESMLIAPQLMIPFASIIREGERPFSMFRALQAKYDWILPTWVYRSQSHLVSQLKTRIVDPCERVRLELTRRRKPVGAEPRRPGKKVETRHDPSATWLPD